MSEFWQQRWRRWLQNRLPASREQTLSHRSIFILPSGAGIAYLLMCLVLFVLGTNYQNNLILALTFLLLSVFHTSLLMAFRNLTGLQLSAGASQGCHQQQYAIFSVSLSANRPRHHLRLRFAKGEQQVVDVAPDQPSLCDMQQLAQRRGLLNPGRIWIESRYPLGLCRAWSVQDLALSATIWPQAIPGPTGFDNSGDDDQDNPEKYRSGLDDFHGLERWQPGDSQSRVAWKQVAQSGTWQIKQFIEPVATPRLLTLAPQIELEQGLSHLTDKLLQLEQQQHPYALQLGELQFDASLGTSHLQRCLDALALYRVTP
ncbi:DUF58 domain-containing protein [uncultured Ferrimonas sp.]|uniref:DUF58 domain-containing protein n=1 Tax=uncultured Ferrimonas sp. TaxID=432640 RepID=UPI0026141504|nr:DUF58 domain-containing protein [uncultured Ferrimonas sp.]